MDISKLTKKQAYDQIEKIQKHIDKLVEQEGRVIWFCHKFTTREYDGCHQKENINHWHYYTPDEAKDHKDLFDMEVVLKPKSWERKNIN